MAKVKVRIAVAVDPGGAWSSCGWSRGNERDLAELARESMSEGDRLYWLTAELDVPEPEVIAAVVEERQT